MNNPIDIQPLLSAFSSAFNDANRSLSLVYAPNSGFAPDFLLPLRLESHEALSEPGYHRITALSADATIEVKSLLGKAMGISIRNPDGSYHPICGIVNRVHPRQSDGGLAQYDIELVPSIDLLKHSRNSRTFQQKSVPEIVKTLLNDLRANHASSGECFEIRDELTQTYPSRDHTIQYRESTFAFITRLLREEGISYRIEHEIVNDMPLHRIVFFDDAWDLPETEYDSGNIRFHRNDATEETNSIDKWESERKIQSNVVSHSSWDYRRAATDSASESTWIENGESAPNLEDFDAQTHHYGNDTNLPDYAAKRQQAYDLKTKTFFAEGNITHLNLGNTFTLKDHPVHDQDAREQRQFVVLGQTIDAWNNLPDGLKALSSEAANSKQENPFRTKLTLVRRGIAIVPEYSHTEHAKPTAPGPQTATVVGPAGHNEVYTNERGDVKLQFHWQRPQDHGLDYTGSLANFDEHSSIWIRVAQDIAGDGWGDQHIPRVGQTGLVIFLENDIDRPVWVGGIHDARHANPTFSGTGSLPANRTLSGFKSKEFDGHGYNEILSDDTTGELRQKISREHAKTQLNLGYLIHPRIEGKGEPRGEGAEIRSDAAIALRGAWGLLLSADARYKATGKQLDRQELKARLNAAKELLITYGDLANTHHADNTELEALKGLIERIENWEKGSNTDKNGTNGNAPIIALTAPADIVMSSGEATAITTGTNLDIITQQSTQITAGKNFVARVKERISFFAHKFGIKIIAASGKVEIQAHSDNIEATAQKKIILVALEEIILKAPKATIITDGASYEIGAGGIITKTIGTHTAHAAYHNPTGPAGVPLVLPMLPGWVPIIEETRQLQSTYALDQLTLVAQQSSQPEFVAFLMPIFGPEIPPEVYFKLQDALIANQIKNPEIEVFKSGAGHIAAFDQKSRKILVSAYVADNAPKSREDSWLLLAALLEEFGHYIDLVLRNDLSEIAGDAKDDEGAFFAYRISHIDFAGTSETEFAHYKAPKYTGPLKVKYPEFQAGISKWVNKASIADDQKQGNLEFFGPGKGEDKKNPHGSFGHESIEDVLGRIDFEPRTRRQIYFGNWLRDFSQMVDPAFTRKEGSPEKFPFMTRKAMTELVKIKASLEFVKEASDTKLYQLNTSLLGVYRPVEHIDNPKNFKPGNPRAIDPDFAEPVPVGSPLLEIDPATSMKRYIAKSADYMAEQLRLAVAKGRTPEGFRHFGAALHVLEDYFAHSNFVELALRKVGYTKVLAWTSPATCKHKYPIVTGMFDSEDVIASTAGVIAELLFPVEWEFKRLKPGERTPSDKTTLVLLGEHEDKRYLNGFNIYLWARDVKLSVPGSEYIDMALHYTVGMHANATNFLFSSLVHLVGNSVDDAQTTLKSDPNTNGSTDPTHSQLAKDHDNHAFHTLAAELAKVAVLKVGEAMRDAWSGVPSADPAKAARAFIVHPNDAIWMDSQVIHWARANPKNLNRGESNTEWQALRAEHEKEVREKIQQAQVRSQQFWEYNNKHYQTLFGDKNQVKK